MTPASPEHASPWSPIPWSALPAHFQSQSDHWPQPRQPSAAEVFWWRAAVVVLFVFPAACFWPSPPEGSELTGLQLVALWCVIPLAIIYGAVFVVAVARPRFPRSSQVDEIIRRTRAARRQTLRAIRRDHPIPPDRERLARLWIVHDRAQLRHRAQTGLLLTYLLIVWVDQPSWPTVVLLAAATLWLGAVVETLRRERAVRHWLAACGDAGCLPN